MSEALVLMNRESLQQALAPTEDIHHTDLELGFGSGISFTTTNGDQKIPVVKVGTREIEMTTQGYYEAARIVGISRAYAERCPSEKLNDHMNYWNTGGCKGKARFYTKDGKVIGASVSRPDYYSNVRILERVEREVGQNNVLGYHQVSSNLEESFFSVVTNRELAVNANDRLFGGIEVHNSIVGNNQIEISPYIFRQVCVNGAIVTESVGHWSRRANGDDFDPWVHSSTREALQELDVEFLRIRKLTEVDVSGQHLPDTLRSLFRKFAIPIRTQEKIVEVAENMNGGQGPKTMYDIYNAITAFASHSPSISRSSARFLRRTAGDLTREYGLCPNCHQICETGSHS